MSDIGINSISRLGKELFHIWLRYATNIELRLRFQTVFKPHPEYRRPIARDVEKNHIKLWRELSNDINLDTLRICSNVSLVVSSINAKASLSVGALAVIFLDSTRLASIIGISLALPTNPRA